MSTTWAQYCGSGVWHGVTGFSLRVSQGWSQCVSCSESSSGGSGGDTMSISFSWLVEFNSLWLDGWGLKSYFMLAIGRGCLLLLKAVSVLATWSPSYTSQKAHRILPCFTFLLLPTQQRKLLLKGSHDQVRSVGTALSFLFNCAI
jgi:hypothetical protein